MIIGSHNSWSFLKPKKWWMRLFRWCVRCQDYDIETQYEEYGVRCFDLRINFTKQGALRVVHNKCVFDINYDELYNDLIYLNSKKNCYIRVINDVRTKDGYTDTEVGQFKCLCRHLEAVFNNSKFWCGRNLYNWNVDYIFKCNPTCAERYGSVTKPKWFNGLYPRKYAKKHNAEIIDFGTSRDILLIDFVNIK